MPLEGARVAIQGFGRVGMTVAEELTAAGMHVVAIADDRDGVTHAGGIDVPRAIEWMREHDAIAGLPGSEGCTRAEVLGLDCDILVPAGLQGVLTAGNADAVRARIVAEVANGATSAAADGALADRGITVIPDILCTSGGTVLGYFEWVQDMQAFFMERGGDHGAARPRRRRGHDESVQAMAAGEHVDLRARP